VVMQTMSKVFGLAGIRVGVAFANPAVARLLNSMKAPYNVSNMASRLAMAAMQPKSLQVMRQNVARIKEQRKRMVEEMPKIREVGRFRGGFDANYLLFEVLDGSSGDEGKPSNEVALEVYERLAGERGVVVRFRGKEKWCEGCLRVTVGTEQEVGRFLKELESILAEISSRTNHKKQVPADEEEMEREANGVVG